MSSKKRGGDERKTADAPKSGFAIRLASVVPRKKQGEMAEKLGVSLSTLSRWANGRQMPQLQYVERIAEVAGVRLDWLLKGEGPEQPGDEDLITQRIEALEAVGLSGQTGREEIATELLLLTAQRVRVLEREVAELVRAHREGHPPVEKTEG